VKNIIVDMNGKVGNALHSRSHRVKLGFWDKRLGIRIKFGTLIRHGSYKNFTELSNRKPVVEKRKACD
jgi:hypothetical protein